MPTLLSINNYFYRRGGAETVFLEQNRLFKEIGWEVVPFAMRHAKNHQTPWQEWFTEEIEFGENYSLARKVVNAAKITYSIEARAKLARLVQRVAPSIAHAHNIYHHISPSILGKLKSLGIPTVLTLHDLKIACPAYKMLTHDGVCERCRNGAIWNVAAQRCIKDSLPLSLAILMETAVHRILGCYTRNVDRFVVPSRFYIDKLVEWGWPAERFTHIPNFVDTELLQPCGTPGTGFMYFGRLGPEKGLTTFVRAVALSGTKGSIVGTGSEEMKIRQVVTDLGANIDFLGFRTGDSLLEAISSSRAIVLPSEWYENAPMSVLEAYAMERPVIGANIGGIPELIRPNETGAVFESGNAEDLARVLRDFSGMRANDVLAMGKEGRRWVEQDFTATKYRDRLLDLYHGMGVDR